MLPTNGTLTLQAANTFTGQISVIGEPVFIQGANGASTGAFNTNGGQASLTLNVGGTILNATGALQITNGQLTIDNAATNVAEFAAYMVQIRAAAGTVSRGLRGSIENPRDTPPHARGDHHLLEIVASVPFFLDFRVQ